MRSPVSIRRRFSRLLKIPRRAATVQMLSKKNFKTGAVCIFIICFYVYAKRSAPVAWQEADLRHVFRVISESQDFSVAQMKDINVRRRILQKVFGAGMSSHGFREQDAMFTNASHVLRQYPQKSADEYYPEFFQELNALKLLYVTNMTVLKRLQTLHSFRPILTVLEKIQLLQAFDIFRHVCEAAKVTYFLLEASLMGVRRHHGMIPWDDDIDIVVNASQWKELYALLSSVPGFQLFAPSDVQWKFYTNTSAQSPGKPFKFPYLDIFFFNEDDNFIWAVTQGLKHDLIHKKSDIFPLVLRPFEGRLVKVPNNLKLLVDESHDVSECITGEYNHKTNERFFYRGRISVQCAHLRQVYPFVDREIHKHGYTIETLRIGGKTLGAYKVLNDSISRVTEGQSVDISGI